MYIVHTYVLYMYIYHKETVLVPFCLYKLKFSDLHEIKHKFPAMFQEHFALGIL
jgi:hypothetical protein